MQPDCGGRIVATENLTVQVRRLIDNYREAGRHGGILIGAMQGDADWDWRPLLLERGVVQILRFSDPVLSKAQEKFNLFHGVLNSLQSIGGVALTSYGAHAGQLWIKRQFFKKILSDQEARLASPSLSQPKAIFLDLAETVQQLHKAGIIHGHICPDNLAISVDGLKLLDVCFYVFSRVAQRKVVDVAPELQSGQPASESTDIYSLGLVAKTLLSQDCLETEQVLINRMLNENPALRPTLAEVTYSFRESATAQKTDLFENYNRNPIPPQEQSKKFHSEPAQNAAADSKPLESPSHHSNYAAKKDADQPRSFLFSLVLLLILGGALYFAYDRYSPWFYYKFSGPAVDDASFERFWKSNMPSLMQQVARAALFDDNPAARLVIVRDAINNKGSSTQVRYDLLRIAFNPEWEGDLGADDRRIALSLAFADLLKEEITTPSLPSLEKIHPGVILAITGNLPVERELSQLKQVSLARMATLPARYGAAFDILLRLGVEKMDEKAARALSHFLLGSTNDKIVRAFFRHDEDPKSLFIKLELVLMLSRDLPSLAQESYAVLLTHHPVSTQLLQWFQLENVAGWEKVSERDKLVIVSGSLPTQGLELEQYIDLLRFPREEVRAIAKKQLLQQGLPADMKMTVEFLIGDQNLLTRSQTITLVAALGAKSEQQYKVLTEWLDTNPEFASILDLLIIRSGVEPPDPFNVSVARYLDKQGWKGDLSQLKKLTMHSEPLARALAYSQLGAEKGEELKILREMAKVEPDKRLRQQLQERLKDWQ